MSAPVAPGRGTETTAAGSGPSRVAAASASRRPPAEAPAPGSEADLEMYLDRPTWHWTLTRVVVRLVVGCLFRLRVEGIERYPTGPAVLCFNHMSWFDPFVIVAAVPPTPRLSMFGPREADMSVGWRNRTMGWIGLPVPFRPAKDDLIGATRRAARVLERGRVLHIAGEGRIHVGERALLPLSDGPAYFALRSRVPLVPVAINGTGWLGFGRTIRVRIGEPIAVEGRPTKAAVAALTARLTADLLALVADFPDRRPPGPLWRRLTELFNDWPEGSRPPLPRPNGDPGSGADRPR
jgi:1-acyl-sn-glycerol-3-phosphate acyltransferase